MKVGDKVYISPNSKYYARTSSNHNPMHTIGVIKDIPATTTEFTHQVMWNNGTSNIYAAEDLILAPTNNTISKKYLLDIFANCSIDTRSLHAHIEHNTLTKQILYDLIITQPTDVFLNLVETLRDFGFDIDAIKPT